MSRSSTTTSLILAAVLFVIAYLVLTFQDMHRYAGLSLMALLVVIALAFRSHETLKGYSFTVIIFAAVSLAMY